MLASECICLYPVMYNYSITVGICGVVHDHRDYIYRCSYVVELYYVSKKHLRFGNTHTFN